jgi:2-polyprenyl-3-methyl-5-hydroxy-6-metoxy-1,4-benzoquinol methylase
MPVAAYDEIAEWYDGVLGAGLPLGGAPLLELAGACEGAEDRSGGAPAHSPAPVAGQRVCDLACGQGALARELTRRGARVVGIDLSGRLLAIARRYEEAEPLGIAYLRADAQSLAAVRDAVFDGVVCSLALMDIPDLDATMRTVARVLRPRGWFAFSITHPCFQGPALREVEVQRADGAVVREAGGYFNEGFWRSDYAQGVRGQVGAYHRTLSTYLNAVAAAGLLLERVVEPPATDEGTELGLPKILAARCRR